MDILKYRNSAKKWIGLYTEYLKTCLNKNNNLSDLVNPAEARKNLGIYGEIYFNALPGEYIYDEAKDEYYEKIIVNGKETKGKLIDKYSGHHHDSRYDKIGSAQHVQDQISPLIAKIEEIENKTIVLQNNFNTEVSDKFTKLDKKIDDLDEKKLDKNSINVIFDSKNTSDPSKYPGQVVFICGGDFPHIEISNGSKWITFGSIWG